MSLLDIMHDWDKFKSLKKTYTTDNHSFDSLHHICRDGVNATFRFNYNHANCTVTASVVAYYKNRAYASEFPRGFPIYSTREQVEAACELAFNTFHAPIHELVRVMGDTSDMGSLFARIKMEEING